MAFIAKFMNKKKLDEDGQGTGSDSDFGMKILIPKLPSEAVVDIVAIHGLNGHYLNT